MKALNKPSYMLKDSGRAHPLWAQLLLFAAVFFLAAFSEALTLLIIYTLFPGTEGSVGVANLFNSLGAVVAVYLFCRLLEKKSRASLSLRLAKGTGFISEYLLGLLCGAVLISLTVLFCVLTDAVRVTLSPAPASAGTLLLFFSAFIIQSFNEELLCRGYFLGAIMPAVSLPAAVLISSLAFTAAHLFNSGLTALALINLTLYGVFAALLTLKRGSLWAAAGAHCAWNFMQGNFYGISVSGIALLPSVFSTSLTDGRSLVNGGSFGLEGGLGVTLVLCLAIVCELYFTEQKK